MKFVAILWNFMNTISYMLSSVHLVCLRSSYIVSAVIEEANKEVSKLITRTGTSYTSSESYHGKIVYSGTYTPNSSSGISAFSKAMMPVIIHTHARACLTVVWWCPYILGLGWAGATRLDLMVNRNCFPVN